MNDLTPSFERETGQVILETRLPAGAAGEAPLIPVKARIVRNWDAGAPARSRRRIVRLCRPRDRVATLRREPAGSHRIRDRRIGSARNRSCGIARAERAARRGEDRVCRAVPKFPADAGRSAPSSLGRGEPQGPLAAGPIAPGARINSPMDWSQRTPRERPSRWPLHTSRINVSATQTFCLS